MSTVDVAAPAAVLPAPSELLQGFLGFAALGICAGLGAGEVATAGRSLPAGLLVTGGALMLTAPALIVAHQFMGLRASPDALVGALARGFSVTGRAALGLCPAMLLFSATSDLWLVLFPLAIALAGALGLLYTLQRLIEAEGGPDLRLLGLIAAWAGLVSLVALRLAWDVGQFITG